MGAKLAKGKCLAAVCLVAMLLLPLLGRGQGGTYTISSIKFEWQALSGVATREIQNRQLASSYGYELRVALGPSGSSCNEIGTYRAMKGTKLDEFNSGGGTADPHQYYKFFSHDYKPGDVLQLRWYDHVWTGTLRGRNNVDDLLYPVRGRVTIKEAGSGVVLLSESKFFDITGSVNSDATEVEVRIPWQYNKMAEEDADAAFFTVLNNAGATANDNPSFSLPVPTSAGVTAIEIVLTMDMAQKTRVKEKKIVFASNKEGLSFDNVGTSGRARVRMKSPADKGFFNYAPQRTGRYRDEPLFLPFFEAFPYPNNKTESSGSYTDGYEQVVEGWILVVEARGVAAEGVCVDGQYSRRKVKIKEPSRVALGETTKHEAPDEPAWDGYGTRAGEEYWFVPLWAEGLEIKVTPGRCPAQALKVEYEATGDGYRNLKLYTDATCTNLVASGGEVESGSPLYATLERDNPNECEEISLLWNVNGTPPEGKECDRVGPGEKYTFTPKGAKDQVVKVWGTKRTKRTKLVCDNAAYQVTVGRAVQTSGTEVDCGTTVAVNRKEAGERACIDRVEVWMSGANQGEITWDAAANGWKALEVPVKGEEAKLTFIESLLQYDVSWSVGAGYTLSVKANGSPLGSPAKVACGSPVEIVVTPGIAGQSVQRITAKNGGAEVAKVESSNTLRIEELSQNISEIEVVLGADPTGLTVSVDERFEGDWVAKIKVTNVTQSRPIWSDGEYKVSEGRFAEGDRLEVLFEGVAECVDAGAVKVEVTKRASGALVKTLSKGESCMIENATEGVDVKVVASGKIRYKVTWVSATPASFTVKQGGAELNTGAEVDCGSSIEIVPSVDACQEVESVQVNGAPVMPAPDGRYTYEVTAEVTSIEEVKKVRELEVSWGADLGVTVRVASGGVSSSASPARVKCGVEVSATFTPSAGDGAVQAVTIEEAGRPLAELRRGEAMPTGYSWADGADGAVTIKWTPAGNAKIASVELPKKYSVTFQDLPGVYTVSVTMAGTPLTSPAEVLSGTELVVTVTLENPQQQKVVSVNGDVNVVQSATTPGEYTYKFRLKESTVVTVQLAVQQYKVSYGAAGAGVAVKEVWKNGQGLAKGGTALASGDLVNYGTQVYVHAEAERSAAVQGVEKVVAVYKDGAEVELKPLADEGWYELEKGVQGEITDIRVVVLKLALGEVFVVYSGKALGGEDVTPYGTTKGLVTWSCGTRVLEAGKKHKVKVSDAFRWELSAAPGVSIDDLKPICLAVNGQYALPFMDGSKSKDFSHLVDILPEAIREAVDRQEVTTLRIDTYISVSLRGQELLVLSVEDPHPLGELDVVAAGATSPLNYGESYLVGGGSEVKVKARAESPVVLEKVYLDRQDLGLSLGEELVVKLPAYEANGDNRLKFSAIFSQSAYDECLLNLYVNDPAGGELKVSRGGTALESGKRYQRGIQVEVVAVARAGYYLQRVERDGAPVYVNEQLDTTRLAHSFTQSLPGEEVTIAAYFEKSSRGKVQDVIDGVGDAKWQGVLLYPNPTDGAVRIRGASVAARYSVYDVTGREVLRGVHGGDVELSIDFRSLSSGYYIVRLYGTSGDSMALGVLRR